MKYFSSILVTTEKIKKKIYFYTKLRGNLRTSLVAQTVNRLSTMWETWVRSLGREDPLEKEMASHSSILAWRILWTEELGGLQSMGRKELDTTEQLHFHFTFSEFLMNMRSFCH